MRSLSSSQTLSAGKGPEAHTGSDDTSEGRTWWIMSRFQQLCRGQWSFTVQPIHDKKYMIKLMTCNDGFLFKWEEDNVCYRGREAMPICFKVNDWINITIVCSSSAWMAFIHLPTIHREYIAYLCNMQERIYKNNCKYFLYVCVGVLSLIHSGYFTGETLQWLLSWFARSSKHSELTKGLDQSNVQL